VKRLTSAAVAVSMLFGLAGCGSLGGVPVKLYVLGEAPSPVEAASTRLDRPALELKTVRLPDYLDTQDILIRGGANEVVASTAGRWAERLSVGVTRALVTDLGARLPGYTVVATPSVSGATSSQIYVDFDAFDARVDGSIYLLARWSMTSPSGGVPTELRVALIERTEGAADGAIAAGMSRILHRLADAIAASLLAG
jgi:uncharacterized lipoprotein YmbA